MDYNKKRAKKGDVYIEPINRGRAGTRIEGEYTKDGYRTILTKNGIVYTNNPSDGHLPITKEVEKDRLDIFLGKNGVRKLNKNVPLDKAIIEFYSIHPALHMYGYNGENLNPFCNVSAASVYMFDFDEMGQKDAVYIKEKFKTQMIVMGMSANDCYNLAFAIGMNPQDRDHDELLSLVIPMLEKPETYKIVAEALKDTNLGKKAIAQKAIHYKIVTMRNGIYYYNDAILGQNLDHVLAYFENNADIYSLVKNMVVSKDIAVGRDGVTVANVDKVNVGALMSEVVDETVYADSSSDDDEDPNDTDLPKKEKFKGRKVERFEPKHL